MGLRLIGEKKKSFYSPLFFRKIARIERSPVRAAILVSSVLRGQASGFIAVDFTLIQDGRPWHKALDLEDLTKKKGDC